MRVLTITWRPVNGLSFFFLNKNPKYLKLIRNTLAAKDSDESHPCVCSNAIIEFFIQFNITIIIASLPIISFGYNKGKVREPKKLQNEQTNLKTTARLKFNDCYSWNHLQDQHELISSCSKYSAPKSSKTTSVPLSCFTTLCLLLLDDEDEEEEEDE